MSVVLRAALYPRVSTDEQKKFDRTHRVRLRLERHTAAAANSVPDVAAVLAFL